MPILSRKPPSVPPSPTPPEPGILVAKIIESDTFRSAPMMRTLLTYLWKHQGKPVSEYAVGIDALGRPTTFDPRTDSTVRVQISRLRAKLREFYDSADSSFPLKLSIPLGQHDLQWTYEQPDSPVPQRGYEIPSRVLLLAAGVACGVLGILCLSLLFEVRSLRNTATPPLPRFWRDYLASPKPVEIVLPSPLYFFWPDRGLNVRDLNVSEFSRWPGSPWLSEMASKWGPPTLSQNYVGAPEMNAGIRLLQYLQGQVGQLQVIESRKFGADSLARHNTIFIGMPRTAVYLDQISQKLNFYIERVEPDIVGNRHPRAGELSQFRQINYSTDRVRYPGIIALLPQRPEHTRSLLLLGRSPVSIASMLASVDGLRLLDEQWKKNGSPDAWEMVIEADTYRGDTIANVAAVSFRAISPDFWK